MCKHDLVPHQDVQFLRAMYIPACLIHLHTPHFHSLWLLLLRESLTACYYPYPIPTFSHNRSPFLGEQLLSNSKHLVVMVTIHHDTLPPAKGRCLNLI